MNTNIIKSNKNQLELPNVLETTIPHIEQLVTLFNLPRNIVASDEEIYYAWKELPREISRIPEELRNELIVKMCVAASVGLFDGAISYIWNATIISLKTRLKNFGLGLVAQTLGQKINEDKLNEMMDSELLDICYKLELLSEEGYFFLNHCRDMRNNFSSAHPTIANLDDRELINFISRCCKYGLTPDYHLTGIDISDFLNSVKSSKLNEEQIKEWCLRLKNTFPAQRQMLYPTLLGIYCDSSLGESSRMNALKICMYSLDLIDDKVKSDLIDQHNKYFIKGDQEKISASRLFFQKLGLLGLLSYQEQHSIVKNACSDLLNVHLEFNNFYNEPPFAKRLLELSNSIKIPETVKYNYVLSVITAFVGNEYGVSSAALPYYQKMIENFSPKEIDILLDITHENTIVSSRISNYLRCKNRYIEALNIIDIESLSSKQNNKYMSIKKKFGIK